MARRLVDLGAQVTLVDSLIPQYGGNLVNISGIEDQVKVNIADGARMRVKDARQTFLGIWIRRIIEGKSIEVFGDGKQARDFNYVDDVVDAILLAAADDAANGRVFNLGAADPINLLDPATLLVEVNNEGNYVVVPFPPERKAIDIGDYYSDHRLFCSKMGWTPRVPLREGLARTMAFYRNHAEKY